MGKLLLLYDTTDKDFARDVFDFAQALDIEVEMIPRATDGGRTLQRKEEDAFEAVEAAVFVITPGSQRNGKWFPSPSVADEMGRAKERFKQEPWRLIYLVDAECNIQAVDQIAYIPFTRTDHRVMVEAMTRLILALKDARLFRSAQPPAPAPQVDVAVLVKNTPAKLKEICHALAAKPGGVLMWPQFQQLVLEKLDRDQTEANLAVGDLQNRGLIVWLPPVQTNSWAAMRLTPVGFDLVRIERAAARQQHAAFRKSLAAASGIRAKLLAEGITKKDPPLP
jgi:hypothetical protein